MAVGFIGRFLSQEPPPPDFLDDLRDEEGEDKQADREEYLERDQASPVSGGPDLFHRPDEESEDEGPDNDAQTRAEEIVPKSHLGQPHPEVHGSEWEIDQPQVEYGGKAVSLYGVVILFQFVSYQRGGKFSPQSAAYPESGTGAKHGANPYIEKSPIGPKNRRTQPREKGARQKQAHADRINQHISDRRP